MVHVKLHDIVYLICKHMEYTSKHIYIHVYTCKHYVHVYMQTLVIHTSKHVYIHVNISIYVHRCIHANIVHVYMQTQYIHVYMQT